MSGFKTDEFPEKEYKGSLQSDFVNISVVWLRITGDCAHDSKWNMKRHHHSFYELHVPSDDGMTCRESSSRSRQILSATPVGR